MIARFKILAEEKGRKGAWGMALLVIEVFLKSYLLSLVASLVPNVLTPPLHALRGVRIGKKVFIDRTAYIDNLWPEMITIEEGARVTARSILIAHTSAGPEQKKTNLPFSRKPVTVCKHAFIGAGAILLPGVTVGAYAIVASGAVVTKNVPPGSVVAGNPARVI